MDKLHRDIFSLSFKDKNNKFSDKNGLNIKDLATLLDKLYGALGKTGEQMGLQQIVHGSYQLGFGENATGERASDNENPEDEFHPEVVKTNFINLHNKIGNSYEDILPSEWDYYQFLCKLLKQYDCSAEILCAQKTVSKFSIETLSSWLNKPQTYYQEIDDVHSVTIISIGSKYKLNHPPAITVKTKRGTMRILVTEEQESELLKFYKKGRLNLTVKNKILADQHVVHSRKLLYFTEATGSPIGLENLTIEYGDLFSADGIDAFQELLNDRNSHE